MFTKIKYCVLKLFLNEAIKRDIPYWIDDYHPDIWTLFSYAEFRSLLYYRNKHIPAIVKYIFKDQNNLVIDCEHIDEGLMLIHAHNTEIYADSIGRGVKIWHNVYVGNTEGGGFPIIGNNVYIYTGAIINGAISIGDNSIIGAGSVVTSDVPENSRMVGNPARNLS